MAVKKAKVQPITTNETQPQAPAVPAKAPTVITTNTDTPGPKPVNEVRPQKPPEPPKPAAPVPQIKKPRPVMISTNNIEMIQEQRRKEAEVQQSKTLADAIANNNAGAGAK